MPSNSGSSGNSNTSPKVTESDVTVEEVKAYDPSQPEAPENDTRTYVGVPDNKGGWAHRVPTDEWADYEVKNDLVP